MVLIFDILNYVKPISDIIPLITPICKNSSFSTLIFNLDKSGTGDKNSSGSYPVLLFFFTAPVFVVELFLVLEFLKIKY